LDFDIADIMKKTCPVCNSKFECNVTDISNCECYAVNIDKKTSVYIEKTYTDCLCIDCLKKFNSTSEGDNFKKKQ
jgi:hypothetical protein